MSEWTWKSGDFRSSFAAACYLERLKVNISVSNENEPFLRVSAHQLGQLAVDDADALIKALKKEQP